MQARDRNGHEYEDERLAQLRREKSLREERLLLLREEQGREQERLTQLREDRQMEEAREEWLSRRKRMVDVDTGFERDAAILKRFRATKDWGSIAWRINKLN